MKYILIISILFSCSTKNTSKILQKNFCQQMRSNYLNLGSPSKMLLVLTKDWSTNLAKAQLFEKNKKFEWESKSEEFDVVVGKMGLGLGFNWYNLAKYLKAPLKREGDGKTPFGLHLMGKKFGSAKEYKGDENYFQVTPNAFCVDDKESPYYNQVVNLDTNTKLIANWKSAEKMHEEPLYALGSVVDYQSNPSESSGSCIFLHLWRGDGSGTAGCIAMDKNNLAKVLDESLNKSSLLIAVLTKDSYEKIIGCF